MGAQGHGPVHLLLVSAAELGFAWDGAQKRFGSGVPPSFEDDGWASAAFSLVSLLIFKALYNYFPRPTCGNEIKCC